MYFLFCPLSYTQPTVIITKFNQVRLFLCLKNSNTVCQQFIIWVKSKCLTILYPYEPEHTHFCLISNALPCPTTACTIWPLSNSPNLPPTPSWMAIHSHWHFLFSDKGQARDICFILVGVEVWALPPTTFWYRNDQVKHNTVKHWMKQLFTHTEKKQNKTSFGSEQWSLMASRSSLAGSLACAIPLVSQNKGPRALPTGDRASSGIVQISYHTYA